MINDGYNRHFVMNVQVTQLSQSSLNVWYRPATRGERDQFRFHVKKLSETERRRIIVGWVYSHVVSVDTLHSRTLSNLEGIGYLRGEYAASFEQLFQAINGLVVDSSGHRWVDIEMDWRRNLQEGIQLERTNPLLAKRSCDDCRKYWYSEKTGLPIISNSTGLKEPRVGDTMCQTTSGCLKGTPENQRSLNKANRWAVTHYQQCLAVGSFPDDQIVRENAVIIRSALAKKATK